MHTSTTPEGAALELAFEHGHHVIRIAGVPLMSSAMRGSEEAMAEIAFDEIPNTKNARVLIGGLGLGFTLRSALDVFADDATVCVAELLPSIVECNQKFLSSLNEDALADPRVDVFEGDVRIKLREGRWDAVLMDVDNGPDALSARSNDDLYTARGIKRMADALRPGGVLVLWSAYPSPRLLERLRSAGMSAWTRTVRARWPIQKGPKHTLFVGTAPRQR